MTVTVDVDGARWRLLEILRSQILVSQMMYSELPPPDPGEHLRYFPLQRRGFWQGVSLGNRGDTGSV